MAMISDKDAAEKILGLLPDGRVKKIPFFVRKHAVSITTERIADEYPDLYQAARQPGQIPNTEKEQLRKKIIDIFFQKMAKHHIQ